MPDITSQELLEAQEIVAIQIVKSLTSEQRKNLTVSLKDKNNELAIFRAWCQANPASDEIVIPGAAGSPKPMVKAWSWPKRARQSFNFERCYFRLVQLLYIAFDFFFVKMYAWTVIIGSWILMVWALACRQHLPTAWESLKEVKEWQWIGATVIVLGTSLYSYKEEVLRWLVEWLEKHGAHPTSARAPRKVHVNERRDAEDGTQEDNEPKSGGKSGKSRKSVEEPGHQKGN